MFFPCAQCHQLIAMFPELGKRQESHVIELVHGRGLLRCASCHDATEPVHLHSLSGDKVALDRSHLVCSSCHEQRYKDWAFGAHGKRLNHWRGERVIYTCAHCHDPHNPTLQARKPMPPPRIRSGLVQPISRPFISLRAWENPVPPINMERQTDGEKSP